MNKKVITLCAAALLFGGAMNVATAASEVVVYGTATANAKPVELADGVKFLLKNTSNQYYKVASLKTKDGKDIVTSSTSSTNSVNSASIFEVRNAQANGSGYIVELYVDGVPFVSAVNGSAAEKTANFSELNNKFYIGSKTSDFGLIKTATIPTSSDVIKSYYAATTKLDYKAADLKDFNNEGTTFSFDFSNEELVGNLFKGLTPVTIGANTYFLSGENAKGLTAFNPASIKGKGIQILAIDNKNGYGLNSSVTGEGLKLRMVDAEKFLLNKEGTALLSAATSDSLTLAGFTSILEADQLNNAKEIVLTMTPKNGLLGQNVSGDFNIAAVKTEKNANNAYVTTVKAENKSSWAVYKNALLGDNTYFPASEFLRDKMRAVAVLNVNAYVTTVKAENKSSWAVYKNALLGDNTYFPASEFLRDKMRAVAVLNVTGEAGDENYYKYIVEQAGTYKAASDIDFEMAQNQWIVTKFDGKYGLTLTNRLNKKYLSFSGISKTDKGYKATLEGKTIEFKLLDLSTTKTDGYLVLNEEQLDKGINLSFVGETQVAGEKEFFTATNKAVNEFVPVMDASKAVAINAVEAQKAVESYLSYAYLNAEGKMTTASDTLMVPTYTLKVGENVIANSFDKGNNVVAFAKNMVGNYSVALVKNTNTPLAISSVEVAGIKYNKSTNKNPDGLQYTKADRYDVKQVTGTFATVNVTTFSKLNTSLPAVPGHYTFDNARGSINVKDLVGINEGFLASEGQVFWLDTADVENEHPSFYISFGKDSVAARNYMFNPIDSAKVFDEFTAKYKYNDVYYYGEDAMVDESKNEANGTLKVAFASTVAEKGKDLADAFKFNITLKDDAVADEYVLTSVKDNTLGTLKVAFASTVAEKGKDLADAFKFNITLKDDAVADEYVLTSVKDNTLRVAQKNGVVILVNKDNKEGIEPMAFTVNPAEAPTSNESVVASEVKVVANNGSVVVKNAAGKNVVVSTILGQVVANEVLTSDNATINVPAGIVVVAVDGESFKVSVK